jgi:hypothetical protein
VIKPIEPGIELAVNVFSNLVYLRKGQRDYGGREKQQPSK